jgi:hypothetical protein
MTDQITEAAIEAGRQARAKFWASADCEYADDADVFEADRIFIAAYEAALWQSIETAPPHVPILTNCKHGLIEGEYSPESRGVVEAYYWRDMSWYATHWRPRPQPPEPKS